MLDALTLTSLPLFPLGTVLFPGGLLALQVFEVRYLDMIAKCHKTGAPFGVVALTEGSEVRKPAATSKDGVPGGNGFAPEAFHAVGTLATISQFATPQAGLLLIQCQGMHRFTITRQEQLKHGLWIADVTRIAADLTMEIPADLQKTAVALGQLIEKLQHSGTPPEKMPLQAPYQLDDCGWVANRWCELLPIPLELKQRLMALDSPLLRLELVTDILERTGISL